MRETSPMRKPPTGEPYAGKPHVRFGGRGGESLPDPYQGILSVALASSAAPPRTYGGGRGPLPKVSQQSDAAKQDKLLLTHPTRTGSGYARMQPVASARPGDDDLRASGDRASSGLRDRKSTRLNSSRVAVSDAVCCWERHEAREPVCER